VEGAYEPFGKASVSPASTVENNLRFPGQYYDRETGLHYNYFRDYEPGTGRYVEADPIGIEGGLNVYGYANQSPLTFADPLGLAPYSDPMNQIANRAAGLPPNANLPPSPLPPPIKETEACFKCVYEKVFECQGYFSEGLVPMGPGLVSCTLPPAMQRWKEACKAVCKQCP
jgi:RHS repeat-associated protein